MLLVVAGVLLGSAGQLQQAELWPGEVYRSLCGAGLAGLLLLGGHRVLAVQGGPARRPWRVLLVVLVGSGWLLAGLALGFGQTGWRAQVRLADVLPADLEGPDLQITGVVQGLPVQRPDGVRFLFAVEAAQRFDSGAPVQVPALLSLGWYRGWDAGDVLAAPARSLQAGQRWQLVVRLRQPHGTLNPYGFDVELWLFEQGVRATGTVRLRHVEAARLLDDVAPGWGPDRLGERIDRWRLQLRQALQQRLGPIDPDSPAPGVLAALVVGDQAAIDRDDWAVFRTTGVAHLMAISGLHVTLFAWVAGLVIAAGWRRSRWLMLRVPAVQAGRWGGLAAALAYALLAGWGVPAQRTVLMLAVVALVRSRGRLWPWPRVLALVALVVVLIDPWALLQAGFWLSFVAVAMLLASDTGGVAAPSGGPEAAGPPQPAAGPAELRPSRTRLVERLRATWQALPRHAGEALRVQLLMSVGLAPLTLLFFHQVSLVGLLANLIAIPWVTFLITPLALLGVLAPPLWALAAQGVEALMWLLDRLAAWPLASWQAAAAPLWAVLAGLLGAALLVLPLPRAMRLLGLPLLLPLLDPPLALPPEGQFELLAADIGQGTAVLVRTRRHVLLYDTGPRYSRDSDAGERVLVPLLHALGVGRLDLLVLSHRDQDHVGGAPAVLAGPGAWRVMGGLEPGHALREQAPYQPCLAGQRWHWDGVHFEVLHPRPADYALAAQGQLRPNGLSCVLRIEAASRDGRPGPGRSALLTGDIERAQELQLLDLPAEALRADVLLVPHHGSRTSSTAEWLDRVAPKLAVVQAGYLNRYAHPVPEVMNRYQMHKIRVLRTDSCGAMHFDGANDSYWCERGRERRYWHAPLQGGSGPEIARNLLFIDNQP
jgi:competence protein ComEC